MKVLYIAGYTIGYTIHRSISRSMVHKKRTTYSKRSNRMRRAWKTMGLWGPDPERCFNTSLCTGEAYIVGTRYPNDAEKIIFVKTCWQDRPKVCWAQWKTHFVGCGGWFSYRMEAYDSTGVIGRVIPNPVKGWGPHPERCPGLSDN